MTLKTCKCFNLPDENTFITPVKNMDTGMV